MKFGGPYRVWSSTSKHPYWQKDGFWFHLFGRAFRYRKGRIYRWHV